MRMRRKYSIIELLFSDKWQWVRKLSKCLWVKEYDDSWVKFEQHELDKFKDFLQLEQTSYRQIEDWRRKPHDHTQKERTSEEA